MKKKMLITAFDPFGDSDVNSSQLAVEQLPDAVGAFELRKRIIPTIYATAAQTVLDAVAEFEPDVILCIGLAADRDAVTPERIAVNIRDARIPDNAGNQPQGDFVVPGAPAAYFATIPLTKIVQSIQACGLPAKVSNTAGTFVCNDVFYAVAHRFANSNTRVGFIHVPSLDVLAAEQIATALKAAISACE